MLDWFDGIPPALEGVCLVAAAVAAVIALYRTVYCPIRRHFRRVNAGMDTLLGYPEVTDPGSGRVIQDATPPLALRVYDLEQTNSKMADALATLALNQQRLTKLEAAWEERERLGRQIVEEWMEWRTAHEEEARVREARIAEWERWRVSQTRTVAEIAETHGQENDG